MDNKDRQERLKYARMQRMIQTGAIVLALLLSLIALLNSCGVRQDIADLAAQLRAKKIAQAQAELQAIEEAQAAMTQEPSPSTAPATGGQSITLSFVGDVTLGADMTADDGSFAEHYSQDGASYFFGTSNRSLRGTI